MKRAALALVLSLLAGGALAPAQDASPSPAARTFPGPCRGLVDGKRARLAGVIGKHGFRHRAPVLALAFSPDGQRAASVDVDGVVHGWDLALHDEVWAASGKRRPLVAPRSAVIGFLADGSDVLASDEDHGLVVLDATTGALVRRLATGEAIALAPGGARALVRAGDGLALVDTTDGHEIRRLAAVPGAGRAAVFSPDGKRAALVGGAASAGVVAVLDLETGARLWTDEHGPAPLSSVAFSPDGLTLATAGEETAIRIREAATGKETATLSEHTKPVRGLAFAERRLVSSSDDHTIGVSDLATGKRVATIATPGAGGTLAVSRDGTRALVAPDDDRTLRLLDLALGREVGLDRAAHAGSVTALAVSREGLRVVTAGGDGLIRDWGVATGATGREAQLWGPGLVEHGAARERGPVAVGHLSFADFFVSGSAKSPGDDATIVLLAHGGTRALAGRAPAAVSGDGKVYVAATSTTALEVHELASDRVTATLSSHGGKPRFLALSQKGDRVLLADEAGRLMVWSLAKGGAGRLNEEGAGEVTALAMTPDGKLALVGSRSGAALWDLDAQKPRASYPIADAPVTAVALSPDGKLAVAAGEDGVIRIWETATSALVDSLDSRPSLDVTRCLAFAGPRTLLAGTDRGVVLRFAIADAK